MSEAQQHPCFLCPMDAHPCAVASIEGRILKAYEGNVDGTFLPFVTLHTGTVYISVILNRYYHSLIKGLKAIGSQMHRLTLRVYHLPQQPVIENSNGRTLHRYTANAYTLAVLEPDSVLNITALNQAEYCTRQYLLNQLVPSTTSPATIRGNLVHSCFKELLKDHDLGKLEHSDTTPLETLRHHLDEELRNSNIELALANISGESLRSDVMPHLESLATWFQNQRTTLWDIPLSPLSPASPSTPQEDEPEQQSRNQVRAETFLLAPEIGLRGRMDIFWQQSGRQRLLELKTGGAKGDLPKTEHRWQVQGYHSLLTVRRNSTLKKAIGTLLYSGTPGQAQTFGIPFSVKELHRVIETRNTLVLSHVTGIPPAPPGPSRCTRCSVLHQCEQISALLNWQPPEPATSPLTAQAADTSSSTTSSQHDKPPADKNGLPMTLYTEEDRAFFAKYYELLRLEGRESEHQQALLWHETVEERVQRGGAIRKLELIGKPEPTGQGEWLQTFACENTSELREGDEILLSDGNPITGAVVTGSIMSISSTQVTVWTPELIARPSLLDKYGSDIVHTRTLHNLLRWLHADPHLRSLVAGKTRPRFSDASIPRRPDFNDEQHLAVERAVQAQDYLLVHGPPGTGKTSVIAEIVKQLTARGQRVLLAAFTNQAVDNMLTRLDREGLHDYVRLGHDRSVHTQVQSRLLKHLIDAQQPEESQHLRIRETLRATPIVASTTATWSSEKYAPSPLDSHSELPLFQFDVAIIDEASQLTIPAILGALRFARRFILVGDEQQLPPLVLSKEAAEQGLSDSLFSFLKSLDDGYMKEHEEHGDEKAACVALRTQYRMNQWISHFASKVFYNGTLKAAPEVAKRVLDGQAAIGTGQEAQQEPRWVMQALRPEYPLVFVNASDTDDFDGFKLSNAEARAVRAIVQGLLFRGIEEQDIGIIAPFRAQVANIRRHLFSSDEQSAWEALSPDTAMSIDTVDRFQGGERKVILMSFATTRTPEANNPLRDFLTNPNRLNVALTRAQRKLIVIGNADALAPLPYYERLLAYCRSMKTLIGIR